MRCSGTFLDPTPAGHRVFFQGTAWTPGGRRPELLGAGADEGAGGAPAGCAPRAPARPARRGSRSCRAQGPPCRAGRERPERAGAGVRPHRPRRPAPGPGDAPPPRVTYRPRRPPGLPAPRSRRGEGGAGSTPEAWRPPPFPREPQAAQGIRRPRAFCGWGGPARRSGGGHRAPSPWWPLGAPEHPDLRPLNLCEQRGLQRAHGQWAEPGRPFTLRAQGGHRVVGSPGRNWIRMQPTFLTARLSTELLKEMTR